MCLSEHGPVLHVVGAHFSQTCGCNHRQGKIQAIDAMMGLAGTALGPLIITFSREQLGSYRPIFYILSALPCGMAIVALVFLAKPAPPESAGSMYGKP